jgi:hypothetical protein
MRQNHGLAARLRLEGIFEKEITLVGAERSADNL